MFSIANSLYRPAAIALGLALSFGFSSNGASAAEKAAEPADQPVQTTATYGDWTVRCRTIAQKSDKLCEMIQVIQAKNTQGSIANLAVGRIPGDDKVRLVIQLPIGVHLPSDVSMKVGDEAVASARFQSCFPNFCLARADLDEAAMKRMKASGSMSVSFKDRAERSATIKVSLKGFTAAHEATFKAGS